MARDLRRRSTPAERLLWQMLRGRQVMRAKFRRQHPIGPFVVDFFCKQARLIIEADGAPHFPSPLRDRRRDAWLAAAGFVILRLPNHLSCANPTALSTGSVASWLSIFRLPSPSRRGVGGIGVKRHRRGD